MLDRQFHRLRIAMRCFNPPSVSIVLWVVLLVGCGPNRVPLTGSVSVDGEPVADGYIEFRPLPGTKSPTAGSEIVGGGYEVDADKGVLPGKFRVEIRALRPADKPVFDHLTGKPRQGYEQFLPEQFNHESKLAIDVDDDNTQHDFDLSGASRN